MMDPRFWEQLLREQSVTKPPIMVVVGKHLNNIFASCGLVVEIQPLNC